MMKKYIILLLLLTLLTSCFSNDEDIGNNSLFIATSEIKKEELKKGDIVFDKENKKLYIGKDVEIIPGLLKNYPKEISLYKESKPYTNSNVKNYIFYIVDEDETTEDIGNSYISLFKELGYTRIIDEKNKSLSNLEFVLKYENLDTENEDTINEKYKQRILINIHDKTPENIKKGMGLKGKFIEVYYNQI